MPFTRIILAVLSFCLGIYCLLSAVEIARVTVIPFIIPFIGIKAIDVAVTALHLA